MFKIDNSPGSMGGGFCSNVPGMDGDHHADADAAMFSFFRMAVSDWYCACGDPNWAAFDAK